LNEDSAVAPSARRELDWTNIVFLAGAHAMAIAGIAYLVFVRCSVWTLALAGVWMALSSLSITGGYHRLFAHPTYRCAWPLRVFYLLFGAAAVQNSALKWSSDHRRHHAHTDESSDPYNIQKGFWWAHMGWLFFKDEDEPLDNVRDLEAFPSIRFQDRHYLALAIIIGGLVPAGIAAFWGDPLGGLLVAGFVRLVLQYHATFSINSVAHLIGSQPYSRDTSARDSFLTAIVSLGEGYHNYHHRFPIDYRNGVRAYHFDPTKWWIRALSFVGVVWDLKRAPQSTVERARESVRSAAGAAGTGATS